MNKFDKPSTTELERIQILRSRNIQIDEADKEYAINLMRSASYYTLANSNKFFFCTSNDTEQYKRGTTIQSLYHAHIVQAHFMNLLLKYILHIEQAFKSHLAESITQSFGVNCNENINEMNDNYLSPKHYRTQYGNRVNICKKIATEYVASPSPHTSTRYYKKHKNHIPPWILVRDMPFGVLQQWFSILKQKESNYIIENMTKFQPELFNKNLQFGDQHFLFASMLSLLKESRNAIAHGDRLYPYRLGRKLPKSIISKSINEKLSWVINHTGDTMAVILSIITLLPNKMLRDLFVIEINNQIMLLRQFDTSPVTLEELLGLPIDYANKIQAFAK